MRARRLRSLRQDGAILLLVLLFLLVSSLAASSLVVAHATQARREREEQLLFAGDQIRKAILAYYNTTPPGGTRALPRSLESLVSDERFPTPAHHLRRVYVDPMTGRPDWGLLIVAGGIAGVRSRSSEAPLKKAGFPREYERFAQASSYSEWVFAIR